MWLLLIGPPHLPLSLSGPFVNFWVVLLKKSHKIPWLALEASLGQKIGERQRPRRDSHSPVACFHAQPCRGSRLQRPCRLIPLARCMSFSRTHARQSRVTPVANLPRPLASPTSISCLAVGSNARGMVPLGRWVLLPSISEFGSLQAQWCIKKEKYNPIG